jgi:pilus assembly protein CpaB
MRIVFGLVLLFGIALAGTAVYMARDYVTQYQAQLAERQAEERAMREQIVPTTEVYVLKSPLRYGQKLRPEDVQLVRWPVDAIPEGAFTKEDELFPANTQELRSVTRIMEKGEAVMRVKVTEPGQDAGVGSRLAAGMRAFALRVDVASGVSGFVRPGDRVDVYWTGRPPGGDGSDITKLIDSNVRIIAIDQTADEDRSSPLVARTVTVEATPQQVAALAQAQATGRLQLSLVGADDETTSEVTQVDQRTLLGIERRVVEQQEVCSIRTRRGGEIVEVPIQCTN